MSWLSDLELSFGKPTSFKSVFFRYGIALGLVNIALFVSLLLQGILPDAFLLLFLAAIVASGWFGSIGPGLFAVVLSVVAMDYYFIPPYRAFSVHAEEVPYVVSFLVGGIIASWLSAARRVAEARQKVHLDELFEQAPEAILLVDGKDRVLRVNLKGVFLAGQAVARRMADRVRAGGPAGTIINMSSVNAVFAIPNQVPYSVSKGGVNQLTKVMALSLASYGIRVNAIGPGSIMTDILKAVANDKAAMDRIMMRTPLGRIGDPSEIASIAAFLASDDASYITGQTIYADGGRLPLNYTVPIKNA